MSKSSFRTTVKFINLLFLFLSILLCIYLLPSLVDSYRKGYTWKEMDWNNDGCTSLAEFLSSKYVDKNTKSVGNNISLTEYKFYTCVVKQEQGNVVETMTNIKHSPGCQDFANSVFYNGLILRLIALCLSINVVMTGILAYFKINKTRKAT